MQINLLLESFSWKQIQSAYIILRHLYDSGAKISDFMDFVYNKIHFKEINLKKPTFPKCPWCKLPLRLAEVNTFPGNQLEDKSLKSVWFCFNTEGCGYQAFSKLNVTDWLNDEEKRNNFENYIEEVI